MEDFLYSYNQPKKFGKYDLFLDGKITANEIVYKHITQQEDGSKEIENINLADKVKEIESKLQTHFEFKTVDVLPDEGEETVIYLVANDDESGDKDGYNEYMWVKEKGGFELIGSGTYAQQQVDLEKEIEARTNADTALDKKIEKRVVINDPITITEGDNTTSITSDTISTTTLSGTLDAESMKNSLTAEAIQTVVPMAWFDSGTATANYYGSTAFGVKTLASTNAIALGYGAEAYTNAIALGYNAKTLNGTYHEIVIGQEATANNHCTITVGSNFGENVNGSITWHKTRTEGTGSITIGAGANTLNNGDTESSNSVTIGCKALNKGADSVVIGAQAKVEGNAAIAIGAGAEAKKSEYWGSGTAVGVIAKANLGGAAIGENANCEQGFSVSVGANSRARYSGTAIGNSAFAQQESIAVGYGAKADSAHASAYGILASAKKDYSIAIGYGVKVNDYGAVVIRSRAEDGTKTQLYFSGQNTPLALKYYPTEWEKKQDVDEQGNPKVDDEGNPIMIDDKDKPTKGQAMMGYVVSKEVTNDEGKKEIQVVECGTNLLAALFPNHGLGDNPFQPTTTAIDDEERVTFHPSDLDLPIEEPSENNDVEINIPTIETPIEEEYKPLPVYPIVEPTIEEITN